MTALYLVWNTFGMLVLLFRWPAVGKRRWQPRAWTAYTMINCVSLFVLALGPYLGAAVRPQPPNALWLIIWSAIGSGLVAVATLFYRPPQPPMRRLLGGYDVAKVLGAIWLATMVAPVPGSVRTVLMFVLPTLVGAGVLVYRCWRVARHGRLDVVAFVVGALAVVLLAYEIAHIVAGTPFIPATPMVALVARVPAGVDVVSRAWRWLDMWRAFGRLRPLHRALRKVNPAAVLVSRGKRFDPYHRIRRSLLELGEWRWALSARFDPTVAAQADRLGRRAGLTGTALSAVVEAAQLKAAASKPPRGNADVRTLTADGTGVAGERAWWTAVALAYRRSPVVASSVG